MTRYAEIVGVVAAAIEDYLAAHPDAADNAEGIQLWWLPHLLRERPMSDVMAALEMLELKKVVVKIRLEGAAAIYASASRCKSRMH